MKRVIKASEGEVIFEDPWFSFQRVSGIGMNDTPYKDLRVKSKGLADKHVVEIRLSRPTSTPAFDGTPGEYTYRTAYIAHGMRGVSDSLEDTEEYIEVLEDAVAFARKVIRWLRTHNEGATQ